MTALLSTLRGPRAIALCALAASCALPGTASAGVALSTSGWEWSDPSPQGYTLNDIQFAGARGYAVGAGGTALRTDDGGTTWSGLFTGTSTTANSIDLIGPDALAIATGDEANCSIRLSTNGGATFKHLPVGDDEADCGSSAFRSFDFVTPTTGYVLRSGGAVITTTNGGDTFASRSAVDGGTSIRFLSEQVGYATSSNGKLYRTTDGAQTWQPIHEAGGPLEEVRLTSPTSLVAWGQDRLVRSTDGGATFQPGSGVGNPTRMTWTDANRLAFVSDAKLLLSDDGGVTMREVTLGNRDVIAAGFVDAGRLVAVGRGGVTYVSTDAGANFARLSTDRVASSISHIHETPGGPVGIGSAGNIARVEGGKWISRPTLSSAAVIDADFSSAERGYVLQGANRLLQTTDNGRSWKIVSSGAPSAVAQVVTPDDNTVLLFGGFGILRATSGGAFAPVTAKLVAKLKPAGAESRGGRVVVWTNKAKTNPLVSPDAGKTWRSVKLPKGITRTSDLQPLPGKGLLLTSAGRVFRATADTGRTWVEISTIGTRTDQGAPGLTAASATEYFTGVQSGGWPVPVVLHTVDAGKTWQPQVVGASGTFVSSLVTAGPKTAFVLSTGNGPAENSIFATANGGARGAATQLSLKATKSKLRRTGGKVLIAGQLSGGLGGERVYVAMRKVGSASWTSAYVEVGANGGGSFTASLRASKGKYVAVAQWAGDSGRAGTGTSAKTITITK
ncbi:MAG: hypothetical protein JHD16_01520 [Solirubrobacteraceae bacterium]|nr:hypothetical protein [Solirubrobacteraceae bacterium]